MTPLDTLPLDELEAVRLLEALAAAAESAGTDPEALAALAVLVRAAGPQVAAWAALSLEPCPPPVDYLVALAELARRAGTDPGRLEALAVAVRTLADCATLAVRARRGD